MAKVLPAAPFEGANENLAATTAPQDVSREDAATFDVLRKMREDILCCVLKPDQKLKFGELRQRYDTSVGTLREALSHLVSEGLARTEAGMGDGQFVRKAAKFSARGKGRPPRNAPCGAA